VASLLDAMEGVLENKVARASTMLANGMDELRSHAGKARGSIARATISAGTRVPDPGASDGVVPAPGSDGDLLEFVR
jgi:hypothetical protein